MSAKRQVGPVALLFSFISVAWLSAEPSGRQSKLSHEDILFRATFDDSVDAQVFKGNPKASLDGPVVFEKGKFGKAIVTGEKGVRLTYTVGSHGYDPNLNCRQGSVSFYFKAVDWEPSEKRSHLFFRISNLSLLRVFTDQNGMLAFETGTDLHQKNGVRASLSDKKGGEWIHVLATWGEREIRLYVDGKLAARKANEDRFLSYALNTTFEVGDMPRGMGRESARKTLIDDFTLYRRPLAEDELHRVETSKPDNSSPEYQPPVAAIPRAVQSPVIDGNFSADEWKVAAELTNFSSVTDLKLAPVQTKAYVTYDRKKMFIALRSPVLPGVPLRAECKLRDQNVWNDDATQIFLTVPSGNRLQFVGNSIGTIFDRKYVKGTKYDVTWNGDWKFGSAVKDNIWTAELSISFDELGTEPPEPGETWRFNVTRDRAQPQNLSAWPTINGYGDLENFGTIVFVERGPSVITAPSFDGIIGTRANLQARITGAALTESSLVEVEWLAAAKGEVLFRRSQDIKIEPGKETQLLLDEVFSRPADMFSFIVKNKQTGKIIYRDMASFGLRQAITLSFSPLPSAGICKVNLRVGNPAVAAANPSAKIEVVAKGSNTAVAVMKLERLEKGRGSAQFEVGKLEAGIYDVRTEIIRGGKTLAQKTDQFTKPHEPWRGQTLGLSETPPPPWTPIRVQEKDGSVAVRCWNREVAFRGSTLPYQMKNTKQNVLSSPIQLFARAAGEDQAWSAGKLRITSQDKNQVTLKTTQTSKALSLQTKTSMEFDGLIWTEITVTPKQAVQLQTLDLLVPIKSRFAKYRHWPGNVALTGNLGRTKGWQWKSELPRRSYFWIGNDDLGLTWFFETLSQFLYADEKATVELLRDEDALYLKIHFVGAPVALKKPLTLSFGFQATPTRPRMKGWRAYGGGNIIGTNIEGFGRSEELTRYGSGYPEAANLDYYRRFVKEKQDWGWKAFPFSLITWSANFSPEMQYNVADWDLSGGVVKYSNSRKFWWGHVVCSASESYRDFYVWKAREFIRKTGVDGLYHDLQWNSRCGNSNHGPGESHRSIRADRALNRRIYTVMKTQFNRQVLRWDHASSLVCSVSSPFSDFFLTGEEMRRYPPEGKHPDYKVRANYFHNMRLDYFRACGATGRQWGVAPMFLIQMTDGGPGQMDALYSILLAHDAIPISEALAKDIRYIRRVQRTVAEFGIGADDLEFMPYWHENTPAKVTFTPNGGGPIRPFQVKYEIPDESRLRPEEAIGVSIYTRPGKRSLVVVFNYTEDDGIAKVHIDTSALGLRGERVLATDAFTRLSWVRAGGELVMPVKSLSYRPIWVEALDEVDYKRAKIIETFPPYPKESLLAGYRPVYPNKERMDVEVVGDIQTKPFTGDSPIRTELAQTFSIKTPSKLHRVEVYHRDTTGAFAIRQPVRVAIVKLGADGLPTDEAIVSADHFAPTWVDARLWRYSHFELKRSVMIAPGRYALVISKPAEAPEEFFHTRFPSVPSKKLPGENIFTRKIPTRLGKALNWKKDTNKVICFGVYGFTAP